ncbi:MAG: ATP-binding protein, partial [Myxococcales bacterium]|nr:ATP-binding protein [Myxococcales bacterium]
MIFPGDLRLDGVRAEPYASVALIGVPLPSIAGAAFPMPPSTPPRPPSVPPCVGREKELEALRSLYLEAQEKGERLALLEGLTGVGKARILREFRSRIRLEGGVVLEGSCIPGRAFGPFSDIVEAALRFLEEVGHAPSFELEALACVDGCHRFWWQHTSTVPGTVPSPSLDDAETSALERRLRLFDTIRSLLQQVAEIRPPVVMIHDLDRADRGTLTLLQFLLDEGSGPWTENVAPERTLRALFVGSVRTDSRAVAGESIGSLRRLEGTRRIEVGHLDEEGVRAYLTAPDTIARIFERTGGMPEAIDLLLEGDPLTPEARVKRIVEDMSTKARSLLEALAALDAPADLDLLATITGAPVDAAARAEFKDCELLTTHITE